MKSPDIHLGSNAKNIKNNPNINIPSVGLNNGFNIKGPNIDIIEYNSPLIFLEYI